MPPRADGHHRLQRSGLYPDDDDCVDWLWRQRFAVDGRTALCPRCDRPTRFYRLRRRRAYACDRCGHQLYPTADTPFSGTTIPLGQWFRAAYELSEDAQGVSGSELARRLGIDYRAALRMRGKLLSAASEPRTARLLRAAGEWYAAGKWPAGGGAEAKPPGDDMASAGRWDPPVEAILRAATRLIAKHGLQDVKVADVAREAGTTSGSVRRAFPSKGALLLACLNWSEERLAARAEELMAAEDDPVRRLRALLELALASPGLLLDEYRLWLEVWVRLRERVHELDDSDVFYGAHDALLDTIRQGRALGVFKPAASAESIAESMIAMSDGLAFKVAEDYPEITVRRSRELLHLFCERMLGLAPGTLDDPT